MNIKENITSNKVYKSINSQGIKANGFIFLTQVGKDPISGETEIGFIKQAKRIMENIKIILEENDSSLDKVVKVTIYLNDLNKAKDFNEIYYSYFSNPSNRPVRACIEVSRLSGNIEIETEIIALA